MNKIISFLILAAITIQVKAQTETFDIASYVAPKDFKKEKKQGVVNYININETKGSFCVIALYESTTSTGDAEKDFKTEWEKLVVQPYKADPNPKTDTQITVDGWKILNGAAPIKLDGTDCYILLTVVSGFGKTMSIRTSLNDEAYATALETLFTNMEFDKTKTATIGNNAQQPANNTITTTANIGAGKFGLLLYSPPAEWSHEVFEDGVVFKPLDLPAGEHLAIQIMQPLTASGTLEQAMANSFEETTIMYKASSMYKAEGKYEKKRRKNLLMAGNISVAKAA